MTKISASLLLLATLALILMPTKAQAGLTVIRSYYTNAELDTMTGQRNLSLACPYVHWGYLSGYFTDEYCF